MALPRVPSAFAALVARVAMLTLVLAPILFTSNAGHAGGAGPYLVKEINPGDDDANINYLIGHKGIAYFSAYSPSSGQEPWRSDGTAQGTYLLKDIRPGATGSSPNLFYSVGEYFYFMATDGSQPTTFLWRSDGTPEGTVPLRDVFPESEAIVDYPLAQLRGTTFFVASTPDTGYELWKSEGDDGDLTLVKDIDSGTGSSYPGTPIVYGGVLYFVADSAEYGDELWRSDGTEAGTFLVKDIYPGSEGGRGYFDDHLCYKDHIYFTADDEVHGQELWQSDGTEAGTTLVKDIYPGETGAHIQWMAVAGNTLFLQARHPDYGHELWKSDGSAAGTVLVKDIIPGPGDSYNYILHPSIDAVGETAYFTAYAGPADLTPVRWMSNGDAGGTLPVDVPGFGHTRSASGATAENDLIFFLGNDPDSLQLVVTDLTPGGTAVYDPPLNLNSRIARWRAITGDRMFFTAAPAGTTNDELWAFKGAVYNSEGDCSTFEKFIPLVGGK